VVRMVDRIRRRPPPTANWGRRSFASRLIALGRLSSNGAEPVKRDTEEQSANCDEFKPNHAETRSAAQGVDGDACMMVTRTARKTLTAVTKNGWMEPQDGNGDRPSEHVLFRSAKA
jgi:hypothetical protein